MLDSHEADDLALRQPKPAHVDGDDMTYSPVGDNRTSTQRIDELAALVMGLTLKVNLLEKQLEQMQGD